jgi:riboflavin biosynthesis pyrimidine reductase
MRALLPEPGTDIDVHAHYAAGWLERGGIRANMVASVDGAAAAGGKSAGLQTPGDNRVFAALRDLADVVLVGWSTAATEDYGPGSPGARRAEFGLASRLPIAVVSRSLRIDPSQRLFADPARRPLVVTCASSDEQRRAELGERSTVLVCGTDEIDYRQVRQAFAELGLTRVLCEGGPRILAQVLASGELDELCLSVSPIAVGPGAGRIVAGDDATGGPRPLLLTGLLEEDGALFLRYA